MGRSYWIFGIPGREEYFHIDTGPPVPTGRCAIACFLGKLTLLLLLEKHLFDEVRVEVPLEEVPVVHHPDVERDRRLDSRYDVFAERPLHPGDRLLPVLPPGDQLRDDRVVVDGDLEPLEDPRVVSDAGAARSPKGGDTSGARHEVVVGVLRIDAALDRVPGLLYLLLPDGEWMAGRDPDLLLDDVDAGYHLGNRVLYLEPRVHLEEVEVDVLVHQELDRSGPFVLCRPCGVDRHLPHRRPDLGGDDHRRGLLDHLLVPPLDGTLPLAQMHVVPVLVAEELDFHVARLLDVFLDVDRVVAEGGLRLGFRHPQRGAQVPLLLNEAHPLAASARRGLQHHRETDRSRDPKDLLLGRYRLHRPGHHRDSCCLHRLPGEGLGPHRPHRMGGRADQLDLLFFAPLGEDRVLRKEAVPGVDRFRAAFSRYVDDLVDHEVRFRGGGRPDKVRLVGVPDVERVPVHLGVDRHGLDSHFPARPLHPDGDLSPVRNQYFLEQGSLL
jgi:hypothetical protein